MSTRRTSKSSDESQNVPQCIHWSTEEVADWIENLGFKEYKVESILY